MSDASLAALANLRSADNFSWSIVALFALTLWVYSATIRRGRGGEVLLALTFVLAEAVFELANALVLHFTGRAAVWSTPGETAFLLYVGLPLELVFLFSLLPLALFNFLPADRQVRVFGVPNRIAIPVAFGLLALAVEVTLNAWGAAVWEWWFWQRPWVVLPALTYIGLMLGLAWLNDHLSTRARVVALVSAASVWAVGHLVFAALLGWA
jgi:hypothetical protein